MRDHQAVQRRQAYRLAAAPSGDSMGDSWLSVAGSSSEAALVPKDTAGIASALSALSAAQLRQVVDAITTPTSDS